jgi:hypothetical protein
MHGALALAGADGGQPHQLAPHPLAHGERAHLEDALRHAADLGDQQRIRWSATVLLASSATKRSAGMRASRQSLVATMAEVRTPPSIAANSPTTVAGAEVGVDDLAAVGRDAVGAPPCRRG